MSFVIGRGSDAETVQAGHVGQYRALDGSEGADLYVDLDGPHAMLVVGKRGYGKSFTMGVLAEELARTSGVAPVVVDPMGAFSTLADGGDDETVPADVVETPTITADVLDPRSWCSLLGLSPESGAGGLVWEAAQRTHSLEAMAESLEASDAPEADVRAARNHIRLARSWDVFDPDGLDGAALSGTEITVLDVSGLDSAPMNAVCRGIGEALYRARVDERIDRLPWLLIDEAHTFFDGVAQQALRTILTRGRAPGVSLVLATQRPSAVSETAISQSDVLISHRLTSEADLEALSAAQPTYMNESLDDRLPTDPGEVVVIDDATETIHAAQVRLRKTPHGGGSPSARDVVDLE
ncbi:ATP-binding protein [Salinadaptatus halalkaliphilus]|uniref:ATP-binding protein n=1 Tax=Salinadaptatus halalkaliphilus TaxID=2419781 RepID=A0A4V3VL60_9EURY|nr:ATP-binding protein [Salinadaptatus halalkaliphilus]THE64427.1 ATP-binding protein [Salinadaptatus halalkaliphilus]